MRKEFQSRQLFGPNIDYIDEISIPEPKRQNDNKEVQTLAASDRDFFRNIHTLIHIFCTLPITSAKCERSFSALRRLKTYLRSAMSSERESGLASLNIDYNGDINIEEVINTFT